LVRFTTQIVVDGMIPAPSLKTELVIVSQISSVRSCLMQRAEKSIRVNAPADTVYQFWRNFENFPRFMEHVEEVRPLGGDDRMSHWKIKGPLGKSVEFDAELTRDKPGKEIGWNSRGGDRE
jgi:uncharacterized membrane protein